MEDNYWLLRLLRRPPPLLAPSPRAVNSKIAHNLDGKERERERKKERERKAAIMGVAFSLSLSLSLSGGPKIGSKEGKCFAAMLPIQYMFCSFSFLSPGLPGLPEKLKWATQFLEKKTCSSTANKRPDLYDLKKKVLFAMPNLIAIYSQNVYQIGHLATLLFSLFNMKRKWKSLLLPPFPLFFTTAQTPSSPFFATFGAATPGGSKSSTVM